VINRLTKLGLSLLYYIWCKVLGIIMRMLGKQPGGTLVVLLYHAVKQDNREKFARQMDELLRMASPVSANADGPLKKGRRYAAVTFDDGLQSVLTNAVPELCARQIPATLFVPTGYLGRQPQWNGNQHDACFSDVVMTCDDLRKLSTLKGPHGSLFKIGSHGIAHFDLTRIPDKQLRCELAGSKQQLEEILNHEVDMLAFPYGAYSDRVGQRTIEAGYKRAFLDIPHRSSEATDGFLFGRVYTDPDDWFIEYRLKLVGAYQWLPAAIRLKRKLLRLIRFSSNDAESAEPITL
jgi:peptidoglycan/xylan/chitin deacetylase (PgdA/CDA1 family)